MDMWRPEECEKMAKRSNPDQFQLRLPPGMRDRLKKAAEESNRSMNAEIIARLAESFDSPLRLPDHLLRRITYQAVSQGVSIQREVVGALNALYPEVPTVDDLLYEVDELISKSEKLNPSDDKGFKARLHEYLGKLRERVYSLALMEEVEALREGKEKLVPAGKKEDIHLKDDEGDPF